MREVNKYFVELALNGVSAEIDPSEISFSLKDSIYTIFPTAVIEMNDIEGWILEGRALTNGSEIELTLGYKEYSMKNSYIVNTMETIEGMKSTQLSGNLSSELIHKSYAQNASFVKSYPPNPANIIQELFKESQFNEYLVESTKNIPEKRIYNPYMTKKDFIEKILLPNSVSSKNKISPYFCFIDSLNNFHYQSFEQLMKQSNLYELYFGYKKEYDYYNEAILSFFPFTEKLKNNESDMKVQISYLSDDQNPQFKTKEFPIASLNHGAYPIKEVSIAPQYSFHGVTKESSELKTQIRGVYLQKLSLFPDKIAVTTPIFPDYCAGKKVILQVLYGAGGDVSESFSGEYIIEQSDHTWDGSTQQGFTQLVLGSPSPKYPVKSALSRGLYQ